MEQQGKSDSSKSRIQVRIEEDDMLAYLCIEAPLKASSKELHVDTVEDLLEALKKNEVVAGINQNVLEDIIKNRYYNEEIIVARGRPAVNGKDGYYTIPLAKEIANSMKPRILEDGSVDYSSFGSLCLVKQGDEIAFYTSPTMATHGITVKGHRIIGKNGRDLRPLKGKGFQISEDKKHYIATINGKLEYEENTSISVCNLLVVEEDITVSTGDIDFGGDIHVKGNINIGRSVRAAGTITVDGHVEGATLVAGGDVILKNGMQGGGKGYIEAGGSVSGKFFEQATIISKGNVNANAIMNCNIESEDSVIISGKFGILIGGSVSAFFKIEGTMIGNMAERRTYVKVGSNRTINKMAAEIGVKVRTTEEELEKATQAIRQIEFILKKGNKPELNQKKIQLMRIKITKDSELAKLKERQQEINTIAERSNKAMVVVHKSIYSGVIVNINDSEKLITSENYNVTYHIKDGEVSFSSNI